MTNYVTIIIFVQKTIMTTKICGKCKKNKNASSFHRDSKRPDGLQSYCIKCRKNKRIYTHGYSEKNKPSIIRNKYNLTMEEVNLIFINQDQKCKICGDRYETVSRRGGLYIDHCHNLGHVRGLLCSKCNTMLGNAKDNIDILRKAIDYLKGDKHNKFKT